MTIRDHQVGLLQSPVSQFGEEILPGELVLTISDPRPEDLPYPVLTDTGNQEKSLVEVSYSFPYLEVGCTDEEIGDVRVHRTGQELLHLPIKLFGKRRDVGR